MLALLAASAAGAQQQPQLTNLAVKVGETVILGDIYWLDPNKCQSIMIGRPHIDMLVAPSGGTLRIVDDDRPLNPITYPQCRGKKVRGGRPPPLE